LRAITFFLDVCQENFVEKLSATSFENARKFFSKKIKEKTGVTIDFLPAKENGYRYDMIIGRFYPREHYSRAERKIKSSEELINTVEKAVQIYFPLKFNGGESGCHTPFKTLIPIEDFPEELKTNIVFDVVPEKYFGFTPGIDDVKDALSNDKLLLFEASEKYFSDLKCVVKDGKTFFGADLMFPWENDKVLLVKQTAKANSLPTIIIEY